MNGVFRQSRRPVRSSPVSNPRRTVPGAQSLARSSRFPVSGAQFPAPSPWRAVPDSQSLACSPRRAVLSSVEFLGEMSDVLHAYAPLPLIPPTPFSHKGRRESLGVLMPETGDGTQGLAKKIYPCEGAQSPAHSPWFPVSGAQPPAHSPWFPVSGAQSWCAVPSSHSRRPAPGAQSLVPSLRCAVPGAQSPVPSLRRTVSGSQSPVLSS